MKSIGIIPARYASTRFPGKVLADIEGKPMIQHVWEQAKKSRFLNDVMIACDDPKVEAAAKKFGAKAVMTSPQHASGTDRIAEAVRGLDCDVVLNIQGDEPLVHPQMLEALVQALTVDRESVMSTVIKVITDPSEIANPNVVKAVIDRDQNAMYFSRSAIPFNREGVDFLKLRYYKHFGLYGYRKEFLLRFKELPESPLEETEKLEQLRVLQAGYRIKTVTTDHDTVAVDTPADLERVCAILRSRHG